MLNLFLAVVRRDLMLALRQKSDIIQTLFFFAVVITLVPHGGPGRLQQQGAERRRVQQPVF